MASAANAAPPPTTPSSATTVSGSLPSPRDTGARQLGGKPTSSVKMADRGRRDSPVDQSRRAPPQKAWTQGSNILTQQRNSAQSQPNGNTSQPKPSIPSRTAAPKENSLTDRHSHDRLVFFLGAMVGLTAVFTTTAGDRFEGIVAGSALTPNASKLTMKMVKKLAHATGNHTNGVVAPEAALVGTSPEHTMTFDLRDLADLSVPHFVLPEAPKQANGTAASFRTDTDISGNAGRGRERVLQKWVADGPPDTDISLEAGGIGNWNQFEAHKAQWGDSSTYNEDDYTTRIDRSAPGYARAAANAERIARSIETETTSNVHVREERGQAAENDYDEGARYSDVHKVTLPVEPLKTGGANAYRPPGRRAVPTQPTISETLADPAIISLSKPDPSESSHVAVATTVPAPASDLAASDEDRSGPVDIATDSKPDGSSSPLAEHSEAPRAANASASPQARAVNSTEGVENKVLDQFRKFADHERQLVAERKRAQANHDRNAKIKDLLRFHHTFKLKTPVPNDLVGILAKDPKKQEEIIEKAKKDTEVVKTPSTVQPVPASGTKNPPVPKFDASQVPPPIQGRDTFNRGRGGFASNANANANANANVNAGRGALAPAAQQGTFPGRTAPSQIGQRGGVQQQDRKNQVPAPIPLFDRAPPTGPSAEQSPHRSSLQTPTSATALRFNAKATEFKPNVNAPTFNPSVASNPPSSPSSVQRASSVSRTASPTSFFGHRKVRPVGDRPSILANFNPIRRMQEETKKQSTEKSDGPPKDWASNGGIPNAYHTAPLWTMKTENANKTYRSAFEKAAPSHSPTSSRSHSSQQLPYQGQIPTSVNGSTGMSHVGTPQHNLHGTHHSYGHQYDEHHRVHGSPQVYPSPSMSARQMSYNSQMGPQAQMPYGQPQYFAAPAGQMPMRLGQYPTTPNMMHAQPGQMGAPMMMQQQSSGPYMSVPQQYSQVQMYSPSTAHVYPQQNGYPSPGRMAPMMMHQGSQHGHYGGQQMMYAIPGQAGPMMHGQQGQVNMMRMHGSNPGVYGSSPHQPAQMQQRTMSGGYGQRPGPPPSMPSSGPTGPPAVTNYQQSEVASEDAK